MTPGLADLVSAEDPGTYTARILRWKLALR